VFLSGQDNNFSLGVRFTFDESLLSRYLKNGLQQAKLKPDKKASNMITFGFFM
jgi:hypothetical protein